MKLNLGCILDEIRPQGYINIDTEPFEEHDGVIYKQGDFGSLDWLCEDGSVEEIIINNSICRMRMPIIKEALQNWSNKLCESGVLKIMTIDAYLAAKMFAQNQISLEEYQILLFGKSKDYINHLRSAIDLQTLCSLLNKVGLTIMTKRYDGLSMYVESVKK